MKGHRFWANSLPTAFIKSADRVTGCGSPPGGETVGLKLGIDGHAATAQSPAHRIITSVYWVMKKTRLPRLLFTCALFAACLGIPCLAASPTAGEQVARMGIGINLGNTFDAPKGEGTWCPEPARPAYFDDFKAAGFKHVRLPVTWGNHMQASQPITATIRGSLPAAHRGTPLKRNGGPTSRRPSTSRPWIA